MATFILTDAQKADLALAGADAAGNPKPFFGPVTWSSSDPGVATVTPSADTLTATVTSVAAPADGHPTTVTASAFADTALSVPISGTLDVSVTPSPATQLVITPGAPTPK